MTGKRENRTNPNPKMDEVQDTYEELRSLELRINECHRRGMAGRSRRDLEMVWEDLNRLRQEAQTCARNDPRHMEDYMPMAYKAIEEQRDLTSRMRHMP